MEKDKQTAILQEASPEAEAESEDQEESEPNHVDEDVRQADKKDQEAEDETELEETATVQSQEKADIKAEEEEDHKNANKDDKSEETNKKEKPKRKRNKLNPWQRSVETRLDVALQGTELLLSNHPNEAKEVKADTITPIEARIYGQCAMIGCKADLPQHKNKCDEHRKLILAYDSRMTRLKAKDTNECDNLWSVSTDPTWAKKIEDGEKKLKLLPKGQERRCVNHWMAVCHNKTQIVNCFIRIGEPLEEVNEDEVKEERQHGFTADKYDTFPIIERLMLKEEIVLKGLGQPGPIRIEKKKTQQLVWAAMKAGEKQRN